MSSTPRAQGTRNNSDSQSKGILGEIVDNLAVVFRHLLPGVLIIGIARITHPTWFGHFDSSSWSFLAVVAIIAIAVGNAWFSVNRYVIHQLVDYLCWYFGSQGPAKGDDTGYLDHLAMYVRESLTRQEGLKLAQQHVGFRASSVLLLYTLSELSLLAAVWSDPDALTAHFRYRIVLIVVFFVLFVAAIWQNIVTRRIDAAVLHTNLVPRKKPPKKQTEEEFR